MNLVISNTRYRFPFDLPLYFQSFAIGYFELNSVSLSLESTPFISNSIVFRLFRVDK